MSLISPDLPPLSAHDAARLLAQHYDSGGELSPLAGERDRNFAVARNGQQTHTLKVAWADEPLAVLELQCALMRRLARAALPFAIPQLEQDKHGRDLPQVDLEGRSHHIRLVRWVAGQPLHETPRSRPQLEAIGVAVGQLTRALVSFGHPGAHRRFEWAMQETLQARERLHHLANDTQRALIAAALDDFSRIDLRALPHGVVHGDLNDWNLLVQQGRPDQVAGIIDFGDAHFGPVVADLAVAATYALMDAANPLVALGHLVRGYHRIRPLEVAELEILTDLIRARLCTSLTISAARRAGASEVNEYWFVSEAKGWALLKALSGLRRPHVIGFLRLSCGLEPAEGTRELQHWLGGLGEALRPILERPLARYTCRALSWSDVDDPVVSATIASDHDAAAAAYAAQQRDQAFEVGIGRWGERRAIYAAQAFESRVLSESRRDTHLGLDVFVPAGSALQTMLPAKVVAASNVQLPQDYGGVVLLEHEGPGGRPFRTLWGHLDPASIATLRAGDQIAAGQPFARLGSAEVNGGWVPHLHLQLVLTGEDDPADIIGVGESELLPLWESLYPDATALAGCPPEVTAAHQPESVSLLAVRRDHFAKNLKLSYREPLHIVRGHDVWLVDAHGREYLDCYNNVAHVGHCHPGVVRAIADQAARLNTNTRYLHQLLGEYAERLLRTLPKPLEVCFFTNSGSEANELALRLARTHTGRRETAVLDWAYHGWTPSLIEVSPYKYKRSGGAGRPPFVVELPVPDPYRAPASWSADDCGPRYADLAKTMLDRPVGAFLAETIPSCAGQVVIPQGFLAPTFAHVRSGGGLCILDEVQAGMGRTGDMWAFTEHGVVPDILTLGKPIGNGHPLGAVVTTREVADSFANGMEYFNTFGGNPVSCAAGLAVLDALRDQNLLENARKAGEGIHRGLASLATRFAEVGDVRGRGLFLGVELVTSRESRTPATDLAGRVANHCKRLGVLLGTDGPYDNVIKVRPPMTFQAEHTAILLEVIEEALTESL